MKHSQAMVEAPSLRACLSIDPVHTEEHEQLLYKPDTVPVLLV